MTTSSDSSREDPGELDSELLVQYWLQEASPDEMARIPAWLKSHPEQRARYEQIRFAIKNDEWVQLTPREISVRVAAAVRATTETDTDSLHSGVHSGVRSPVDSRTRRNGPAVRSKNLYIGAMLGVCVLSLVAGLGIGVNRIGASWFGSETEPRISTYTTAPGERATITLSDGSTVLLNVGSRLDVPADYGRRNRALLLTGEALFTVAAAPDLPFVVTTPRATTRVLGTTFMVRQYETDTATVVAVRDGKVSAGSTILTGGQETVVPVAGTPVVAPADPKRFAFAQGVLMIRNERFADVIPDLNRWYNAEIQLGDATLADRLVIGSFENGSVSDLKSILELMFNVRVVRDGRVLILYPRG